MPWWSWLLVQVVPWCCAGVVAVLWWLWATRPRVDAPGPPTLPIIGNMMEFYELPLTVSKMRDLQLQYGDLTRLYLGPVLVMVVAHPDDVQHVLLTSKQVDRDPFSTHIMRIFLGEGILTLNGRHWKEHRKLINRTFHSELLEGFLKSFHEGALFLSEHLANTRGAATEIQSAVLTAVFRTLCSTIIGVDPDLVIPDTFKEEEKFSAVLRDSMATIQKMMFRPWLLSRFLVGMTTAGRSMLKYGQVLQEWATQCIAVRTSVMDEEPAKMRVCLLEALVKPGGQTVMPLSEVRSELVNMAMAGSETSSLTIVYVLTLLALHPDWQDAAHQELRDVFGEGDDYLRPANLADLGRLKVMESIIKETLRLFPVTPVLPRKASEDLWLSRGRVLVPKGTLLTVMPFLTHRMPEFFPDPLRFDPSRFLEDRVGKTHPFSYVPFGLGARNCVGYQYARLQLKVFLADLLRRFRFLPQSCREDLEHNMVSITLHTLNPIRVSCVPLLEPRT